MIMKPLHKGVEWVFKSGVRCFFLVAIVAVVISVIRVTPFAAPREAIPLDEEQMVPHWDGYSRQYFELVHLDKGVHTIVLDFELSQAATVTAETWWAGNGKVYSTPVPLKPYETHKEFRIVAEKNGAICNISVCSEETNESYVPATFHGEIVYRPKMTVFCQTVYTLFPFCLLMVVLAQIRYCRARKDVELSRTVAALALLSLLLCAPLFLEYVPTIHYDTTFHFHRIGHLATALFREGSSFRIQSGWHSDYGYPIGIFYGELLMIPSAILYAGGLPLWQTYQFFLLILFMITIWGGYYCFGRITGNRSVALLAVFLYAGSMWFLTRLYVFSAVGESSAAAFLPWVLLGFHDLFSDNDKKNGVYLVIGFTGILQSHMITFVQVCVFSALFCLLNIRELFSGNRWKKLLEAAGVAILVNLWFLVPFLDYYLRYDLQVENVRGLNNQQSLAEMLFPAEFMFISPGYSAIAALVAAGFFVFSRKKKDRRGHYEKMLFVLSCLALVLATKYMPWEFLRTYLNPLYALIGGRMQLAFRYYTIAVALICMLVAYVLSDRLSGTVRKAVVYTVMLVLALFTLLQDVRMLDSIVNDRERYTVLDEPSTGENGGGDYLYLQREFADHYFYAEEPDRELQTTGSDISVTEYHREGTTFRMHVSNRSAEDGFLTFPIWCYYGYVAKGDNGESFAVTEGDFFKVGVTVPGGYEGNLEVYFATPWYWHLVTAISLLTILTGLVLKVRESGIKPYSFTDNTEEDE